MRHAFNSRQSPTRIELFQNRNSDFVSIMSLPGKPSFVPCGTRSAGLHFWLRVALLFFVGAVNVSAAEPIRLHPANPHYFLFRERPTILVTATEHYGAVLNLDFDYVPYLDVLKTNGFNLTRVFSGAYREIKGSFGIADNTLAPAPGRYAAPWPRSHEPGASVGGSRFDLSKWDEGYFQRLKDFTAQAGQRGVVVELVFFCTFYSEDLWQASPMNARNNINNVGHVSRHEVYSTKERALQEAQENLVRKIVTELKGFDNLYYEVCNEPYERPGLTKEWNDRIVTTIVETEMALHSAHLIAQGFDKHSPRIQNAHPHVSIFNFHSATPDCARSNYGLNKVLADDETGGKGRGDLPYRAEAWEFLLNGGAVYDHLDFTFTVRRPDGTATLTREPGGGGLELRKQLQILKSFIEGFDFLRMKPDSTAVQNLRALSSSSDASAVRASALLEAGQAYLFYFHGGTQCEFELDLSTGVYRGEWIDPRTGKSATIESFEHHGGRSTLRSPNYSSDVALSLKKTKGTGK